MKMIIFLNKEINNRFRFRNKKKIVLISIMILIILFKTLKKMILQKLIYNIMLVNF